MCSEVTVNSLGIHVGLVRPKEATAEKKDTAGKEGYGLVYFAQNATNQPITTTQSHKLV